jgi:putative sterol carrier protein
MSTLATFSNRSELVTAVRGKGAAALRAEASEAGVEMILQKIFMGMMMTFDADKAPGVSAVIEYDIGAPDGARHRYQVKVADGACTIEPNGNASPTVKLEADLPTFLKVSTNTGNPLWLMITRKLKIRGDLKLAGAMKTWFTKKI